jgi:hypothetical protein
VEHQNVIELNGKRYDALTGALLGKSQAEVVSPQPTGRVIDGFIRTKPEHHSSKAAPKTATPVVTPVVKQENAKSVTKIAPKVHAGPKKHTAHQVAAHAKPHQPQKAKTLMRKTVHKPATTIKPAIKIQVASEIAAKPASAIAHKRSAYQVDNRRLEHAQQVARHTAVRHFHAQHGPAAPVQQPVVNHHAAHTAVQTHVSHPEQHHAAPTTHHRDMFEAAIARANSHEQPAHHPHHRRSRRRLVNTLAVIGAFLVIGGFIGYLNMPNLELRVASFQAGFGAQMPGYTPTGFAMRGGVERTGNTVSMQFASGNQNFTITQQPSDWNSRTLVENTLALSNGEHKTVQSGGRTIYIYDDHNAVWVDGNVRYDVTGNAPLTEQDLTTLANSL